MAKFQSNYQALAHHYIYNVDFSECYGNRMFSERYKMYSYGHHYLMALRGDNWIIINHWGSSNTTEKQKRILEQAVPYGWKIWNFDPENHLNFNEIFKDYFSRIDKVINKATRARTKKAYYIDEANTLLNELKSYFEFFKAKFDLRKITKSQKQVLMASDVTEIDIFSIKDKQRKEIQRQKRQAIKQREKERLEKIKKETTDLMKWKNHELGRVYLYHTKESFLRVTNKQTGQFVETSQGLIFDVDECEKLYRLLTVASRVELEGQRITLKGTQYLVKAWNDETLIIGCHIIPRSEVERIAKELNF